MKKLLLIVSLAAILILSGCTSGVLPEARNPVTNPALAKSLITRVRNNVHNNSFEGFTYETSYGECLEKIAPDKLSFARIKANTELLGYPAVVDCAFGDGKGGLLLTSMEFTIHPRDQGSRKEIETDVLAKLDAEFGNHRKTDTGRYDWEKDGLQASFRPYPWPNDPPQMILNRNIKDRFPETPDIFPYKLGTDIYTIYKSLKPCKMPEEAFDSAILDYLDDGIIVNMGFKTDETGVIRYSHGDYSIQLNGMELNESIKYFESIADRLESAIGAPDGRGYYIPSVNKDGNGKVASWGGDLSTKDDMSRQDILNSGSKYYCLNMYWPGLHFGADYVDDAGIIMEFYGNSGLRYK